MMLSRDPDSKTRQLFSSGSHSESFNACCSLILMDSNSKKRWMLLAKA